MSEFDRSVLRSFLGASDAETPLEIRVSVLDGGLESTVARVDVEHVEPRDTPRRFVVKRLEAGREHEARAYRLLRDLELAIAPELLGVREGEDCSYLFIDWVSAAEDWPWSALERAERVAEQLARLHEVHPVPSDVGWCGYERDLADSARETRELIDDLSGSDLPSITLRRAALRRFVDALPEVRRALFEEGPLPAALIHGDAHPGNVMVHAVDGDALLIDWARMRRGSPFEDVSAWVLSLGLWEPRARQRHDRLLTRYLQARGLDEITRDVRDHYWLAAGCNSLAGALRHHVVAALERPQGSEERYEEARAAARWMAIVRRADARWLARCGRRPRTAEA